MKKIILALIVCTSFFWTQTLPAQCNENIDGFDFIGEFQNHFYYTSAAPFEWEAASDRAAANGGYLVSITSQAENDFVTAAINDIVFIGFNDLSSEGNFEWDSNEAVDFNNVTTSNTADVFFGNMNFWNGDWALDGAFVSRKFVLEIECDGTDGGNPDGGDCTDTDGDGVCDEVDCQPSNATIPAPTGTACNDTDSNTINDVIQSDGCTCAGTIEVVDCMDTDGDGVCDEVDCQPNNAAFPTQAGTACDDTNSDTTNDMIQSDGCTCAGTIAPSTGCNVAITSANGGVTITGLTNDANSKLFDPNTTSIWECNPWTGSPCTNSETVSALMIGATYFLSVQSEQCSEWIPVTIIGAGENIATCDDGIQNQGEAGVDCGGPCAPCENDNSENLPSCIDGIQNQGETGVDCGGPCLPCATEGETITVSCQDRQVSTNNFTGNYYEINYADLTDATSDCTANERDLLFISSNPDYAQGNRIGAGSHNISLEIIDRCGNKRTCDFNLNITATTTVGVASDIKIDDNIIISNTLSSTFSPGQINEVAFGVVSFGDQIFGEVEFDIYLSETANSLTNATLLGNYSRQGLNGAGQGFGSSSIIYGSSIIEFPENYPAGDYYLVVVADPNNLVAEANEVNNVASRGITLLGNPKFEDYCAFDILFPRNSEDPESLVDFSVVPANEGVTIKSTINETGFTNYGRTYDTFGNATGITSVFNTSATADFFNFSYGYSISAYGPARFNIRSLRNSASFAIEMLGGVALTAADGDIAEMIDIQITEGKDHLLMYGVYLTTSNTYRSFLLKRMLRGGVVWQQIQEATPTAFEFEFLKVSETGGYYLLKKEDNNINTFQRFDALGNLMWNHNVANDFNFVGERNDNNEVVYTQTNNGVLELVSLKASSGDVELLVDVATVVADGQTSVGQSIEGVLITDFGFVVSATVNNTSIYSKLDQKGGLIWTTEFQEGKEKSIPQFITPDEGIVFGKIADNNNGVLAFYVNEFGQSLPECMETLPPSTPNDCGEFIEGYEFLGTFGDSYYFISNETSVPLVAQDNAFLNGGFLAQIDDSEENDFLQSVISDLVYIGMSDRLVEGQPNWTDLDAPIIYQNFDENCPTCINTEENDFVTMQPWNGQWSWSNEFSARRSVIEVTCSSAGRVVTIDTRNDSDEEAIQKNQSNDWTIAPNPAYNHASITIDLDHAMHTTIDFINASGQVMYQQQQSFTEGHNTVELMIDPLPTGMYFIRIPGVDSTIKRFVKSN